MKIHDITQELFQAPVYPGDPVPKKTSVYSMEKEDECNLSLLTMGSHVGTHVDAPKHFFEDGRTIEKLELKKCIGPCKVVEFYGKVTKEFVEKVLADKTQRLLIKGNVEIGLDGAEAMSQANIFLLGVESPTVGVAETQIPIHKILLGNEIVILEGLVLRNILPGNYFLAAQPLKMEGLDGSPVRAVLIEME